MLFHSYKSKPVPLILYFIICSILSFSCTHLYILTSCLPMNSSSLQNRWGTLRKFDSLAPTFTFKHPSVPLAEKRRIFGNFVSMESKYLLRIPTVKWRGNCITTGASMRTWSASQPRPSSMRASRLRLEARSVFKSPLSSFLKISFLYFYFWSLDYN